MEFVVAIFSANVILALLFNHFILFTLVCTFTDLNIFYPYNNSILNSKIIVSTKV